MHFTLIIIIIIKTPSSAEAAVKQDKYSLQSLSKTAVMTFFFQNIIFFKVRHIFQQNFFFFRQKVLTTFSPSSSLKWCENEVNDERRKYNQTPPSCRMWYCGFSFGGHLTFSFVPSEELILTAKNMQKIQFWVFVSCLFGEICGSKMGGYDITHCD